MLTRGVPIAILWLLLFAGNGFFNGWRSAYDITLAITSPAATKIPLLAYPLSISGWLIAPIVAGAVAGYVITASIQRHRQRPFEQLFGDRPHE